MWKCMMCETNNAENSESCLICHTSKADAKRYYERLKKSSYTDISDRGKSGYATAEKIEKDSNSISISKSESHTMRVADSMKTSGVEMSPRGSSLDWSDLDADINRRNRKLRLVNTCSKAEKVFMIFLIIVTITLLSIPSLTTQVWGIFFTLIVSIYLTARGVTVLNAGKSLQYALKLLIWVVICAFFGFAALICSTIINLF